MVDYGTAERLARTFRVAEDRMPLEAARASEDPENRVGAYVCVEPLGTGGFGSVHRAWDTRLSRWVALKVMRLSNPSALARFEREARLAATLSHPGIAQVFDSGKDRDRFYLAMQIVEGRPLDRAGLTPRASVAAVRDAARAIECAHRMGILHRDLKPSNVMVDAAGHVTVLDFGMARSVGADATALSFTGEVLGTPEFLSPEQARGDSATVGVRTDVYGLGATLYALLTGRGPHADESPLGALRRAVDEDPKSPNVVPDLRAICMKALERDPLRRYASAADLAGDLDRHLRGETVSARPATPIYRLRKRIARQPALWTLGALLFLALAGGATFGVVTLTRSRAYFQRQALVDRTQRRLAEIAQERTRRLSDERLSEIRMELTRMTEELAQAGLWHLRGDALSLLFRDAEAIDDYTRAITSGSLSEFERSRACFARVRARIRSLEESAAASEDVRARNQAVVDDILEDLRHVDVRGLGDEASRIVLLWTALMRLDGKTVEADATQEIERGGGNDMFYALRGMVRSGKARIADYTAAIDRNHGDPRYWFLRGMERGSTGDLEGAVADCTEALRLDPGHYKAINNRGHCAMAMGRYAEAVTDFDRAIVMNPELPPAYVNRGTAYLEMKEFEKARQNFECAERLDPRCIEAIVNQGLVCRREGDQEKAEQHLDRALLINELSPLALLNRGVVREDRGNIEGAIDDMEQFLKLAPRHGYVEKARQRLERLRGLAE